MKDTVDPLYARSEGPAWFDTVMRAKNRSKEGY